MSCLGFFYSRAARIRLAVRFDWPKILRPIDRRDVRNVVALEQFPNHYHILEAGNAHLQPVRPRSAVADQVVAPLSPRSFRPRVYLPRGNPRLRAELQSHRAGRDLLEGLPDDIH